MPDFNPLNERWKKQHEEALLHGSYRDRKTVDTVWRALNLYEEYTGKKDFSTFNKQQAIGFKGWLNKKLNTKGKPYSLSSIRSILHHIREFFKWLGMHPKLARKINVQAVTYLHLSDNELRASCASREKPFLTIEEISITLNAMPSGTDIEKRNRAFVALNALTEVTEALVAELAHRAKK